MKKGLFIVGLVILLVGLFLLATFPSLFYTRARDLNSDEYSTGDKVTVYGNIDRINYIPQIDKTLVELDGNFTFWVNGELKGFEVGDTIYVTVEKTTLFQFGSWKATMWIADKDSVHHLMDMQIYFYLLIIVGIVVLIAGAAIR